MLSKVDSMRMVVNSNVENFVTNLKSLLVADPRLRIMSNDETIISGEIIRELLLDAQMDKSWLFCDGIWSTRKNN